MKPGEQDLLLAIDTTSILADFEEAVRYATEEEGLEVHDRVHQTYLQVLTRTLGNIVPHRPSNPSLSPSITMRSTEASTLHLNEAAQDTSQSRRSLHGGFSLLNTRVDGVEYWQGDRAPADDVLGFMARTNSQDLALNSAISPQRHHSLPSSSSISSMNEPRQGIQTDPIFTETEFSHDQLEQSVWEADFNYDPYLNAGDMDPVSLNMAPDSTRVESESLFGADMNYETWMEQLEFEASSMLATEPWYGKTGEGKNAGNKKLNPQWEPQ